MELVTMGKVAWVFVLIGSFKKKEEVTFNKVARVSVEIGLGLVEARWTFQLDSSIVTGSRGAPAPVTVIPEMS